MAVRRDDLHNRNEFEPELEPAPTNDELRIRGQKARPGTGDKLTPEQFPDLTRDEVDAIPILQPGARLEQGSVYLDLNDPERGPFKAVGSAEVRPGDRFVAKRDADHETWNRISGGRSAEPDTYG